MFLFVSLYACVGGRVFVCVSDLVHVSLRLRLHVSVFACMCMFV